MDILFRHHSVRPSQKELMEDIYNAISTRKILMANAPTGLGKTDSSLSAAITYAKDNGLSVFFLTPKISQHRIAMDASRGIIQKHSLNLRAVDLIGRSHSCIDSALQNLDNDSFQSSCARKRKNKECLYYGNAKGYNRSEEGKAENRFKVLLAEYGSGMGHHDVIQLGRLSHSCPYEWLIKLAEVSNVVIADYYHFLIPQIRDVFLMKIKKRVEDSIVIVDEAHNLAPRIRSSLSRSINTFSFLRMSQEMRLLGLEAGPVYEEFVGWCTSTLAESNEKSISASDFQSFIEKFGLSVEEVALKLEETGLAFVERTGKRSSCLKLSAFLLDWDAEEGSCVRILKRKGTNFYLSKRLLDPSPATKILNECHSSVLMSGTLLPLQMHRDVLGLDPERTIMRSYNSPFDCGNVVNVITENLTTRYSKRDLEGYTSIAGKIDAITSRTPGGTAVFFPSYEVMDKVLPHVLSRNLRVQRPQMKPSEIRQMLDDFKEGGVLCGVQGGSLSEGVDYCEGEIKTVIIVGVALEEISLETRALIEYYDKKFGRGWDYGYLYPGTIKALQAAGRARRKESDRVALVYMDERFKWSKYNWILNRKEKIVVTDSAEEEVEAFWNSKG